jgi:hypothetical protein
MISLSLKDRRGSEEFMHFHGRAAGEIKNGSLYKRYIFSSKDQSHIGVHAVQDTIRLASCRVFGIRTGGLEVCRKDEVFLSRLLHFPSLLCVKTIVPKRVSSIYAACSMQGDLNSDKPVTLQGA